jgi:hypothetical protein
MMRERRQLESSQYGTCPTPVSPRTLERQSAIRAAMGFSAQAAFPLASCRQQRKPVTASINHKRGHPPAFSIAEERRPLGRSERGPTSVLGIDMAPRSLQSPEGLGFFCKTEIEAWWPIIKAAGLAPKWALADGRRPHCKGHGSVVFRSGARKPAVSSGGVSAPVTRPGTVVPELSTKTPKGIG